jgi:transcriptional regulator with XRE-family HTH domain
VGSTPTPGTSIKLSGICPRRLADVTNNTIIKIEGKNQNPTLDTLKKIAKALGISLDDLTN